ncbi:MAG: DMT family transporter [Candidatus Obscuribacterales bacterium]|nr:DMT family transporter [Candidatus Obscuribacterales bacterium]
MQALGSAILFGGSTPAAKYLLADIGPQMLAGLLYLGAGLGLAIIRYRDRKNSKTNKTGNLNNSEMKVLLAAIFCGGLLAPLLMMLGLKSGSGSSASLLLNMESVFTALLAWFMFKENFDFRIIAGMISIVAGSAILSFEPESSFLLSSSLLILLACFFWALDNILTRNISHADASFIASSKGLIAGLANCTIAFCNGQSLPSAGNLAAAFAVGFLGYGLSLLLFIKALDKLGASRCSAYFSCAPFAGALLSIIFLTEKVNGSFLLAGALMLTGVCLHLFEKHEHEHCHEEIEHEHLHEHDEHHQHEHEAGSKTEEAHSHWHRHEALIHSHPHYPDSQHRHEH